MCCQKGEKKASQVHPDAQKPNQHDDKRNGAPLNEQKYHVHFYQLYDAHACLISQSPSMSFSHSWVCFREAAALRETAYTWRESDLIAYGCELPAWLDIGLSALKHAKM